MYEDEERFKLTNIMEFHYIEMTKLIKDWQNEKLDPWNDVLDRWLLLLGMVDHRNKKVYDEIYKELEEIAMKDKLLYSAFENWTALSLDQKQRQAYESRLKRVMDEEAFKSSMESLQRQLEQKQKKIEKGEQDLEKGKQDLEKGKQEVEKGKQDLEKGKQEVEKGKQKLEEGERELEKREQGVEKREQKVETEKRELEQRMKHTATQLLKKGLDIQFVVESTGLPKDIVVEIQRHIEN
nr:PD-(D/E)XK nuclease family transposase [Lederbergia ruris]